jgi:hypothetical protein
MLAQALLFAATREFLVSASRLSECRRDGNAVASPLDGVVGIDASENECKRVVQAHSLTQFEKQVHAKKRQRNKD